MSAHARLQRKKSRDAEREHVPVFAAEPIATQRALPALQPKLTISQPGDPYEQEADRVADQVLRMPDPAIQRSADDAEPEEEPLLVSPADQQPIQRSAAPDEIEAAQPLAQPDEDDQLVQRAADGALAAAPPAEARITALQGGQPLDAATRAFMEPRFGHDFSQVRVHTGAEAAEAARSVNALAYTLGSDVVFGAGQYQPGTEAGRRLLAHELTHVVQQGGTNSSHIARSAVDSKQQLNNLRARHWKARLQGSAGGGYVWGGSVFGLEIVDIIHNVRMYYEYRGGFMTLGPGLSAGLSGASPGSDWKEFTTSKPIRIRDFEGPARHTSAGIQLSHGPSAEWIHLFGPVIAGADSVYLGWFGWWEEGWSGGAGTDVGPLEPISQPEKVAEGY